MKRTAWTPELALERAKECQHRTDFYNKYRQGFRVLSSAGLLESAFPKQPFRWTPDTALQEAKKFQSRVEFRKKSGGAYAYTLLNKICLDHLWPLKVTRTPDEILQSAIATCNYKDEFNARFPHLVRIAQRRNLLAQLPPRPDLTIKEAEAKAAMCSSISNLAKADFVAFRVLKAAGSPALEQIRVKEYRVDVNKALEVAATFETLKDFRETRPDLHTILAKQGLVQGLSLKRGISAFNIETSGFLYAAGLRLSNSTDGILFGITNRHPSVRYRVWEQSLMWGGLALHFAQGVEVTRIELELRRRFKGYRVSDGLSPLQTKKGTTGEILTGLCLSTFKSQLLDLSRSHDWSEVWVTP